MLFGNGQRDYWRDVPEAPAHAVMSRLYLFEGEFFLDITDGTAWKTQVLGKYTGDTRDPVIRARILGTQGVVSIDAYDSNLNRETREFKVASTITTVYGQTVVTGTF
ncbi:hypothetical protein OSH11_11625 [Kaistia dalseonensis]|uniref:Uncharacterized protein n=1 Tax=Kaistia dalseonensis TaxID=410840 RepID=A0ABU0H6K6_9HYPH|nr:hypothetical protein [Kaistia dalseonensis]MCX5495359.1 hypothetical protein [Kaistia dalseonensis]MDQ0437945.1 hypothetical protein [Kaistia dalseonensis]